MAQHGMLFRAGWFSALLIVAACNTGPEFAGDKAKVVQIPPDVNEQSFAAADLGSGSFTHDFEYDTVTRSLQFVADPATVQTRAQLDRRSFRESWQQGHDGDESTDTFPVTEAGQLDLLVVIDDSRSMGKYQDRLAYLDPLLRKIGNVAWRIGVVTTTSPCLRYNDDFPAGQPYITKEQYNADPDMAKENFAWAVRAGATGISDGERGIRRSIEGLRGNCGDPAQPWTRERSNKAVLLLSDEENCGSGSNESCDEGELGKDPEDFITHTPPGTKFYAILYDEEQVPPCEYQGWRLPEQYWWLVEKTQSGDPDPADPDPRPENGIWGNMCETNYDSILMAVSQDIGRIINFEFELAHTPIASSLVIELDGVPLTTGWELDGNVIKLTSQPDLNAVELVVNYRHDPKPQSNTITLSNEAHPDTITITGTDADGQSIDLGNWTYASGVITFVDMPPMRSSAEIIFRENVDLPSVFSFDAEYEPSFFRASVNGSAEPFEVDKVNREVTFKVAPPDGASIQFTFEHPDGRQTRYQAAPQDPPYFAVRAAKPDGGSEVASELVNGYLEFSPGDIERGKSIDVTYYLTPSEDPFTATLEHEPLTETITTEQSNATVGCGDSVTVSGNQISSTCNAAGVGDLNVTYQYVTARHNVFDATGDFPPDGPTSWQVFINEVEFFDYAREGYVITIPEGVLQPLDQVRVRTETRRAPQ